MSIIFLTVCSINTYLSVNSIGAFEKITTVVLKISLQSMVHAR